MKPSADNLILCLIVVLTVAAASVIAWQPFESGHDATVGREFQSALGGFGMGCEVDLTRCSWQFDPRIAGDEELGLNAVVCLGELSPWHSVSMFPTPAQITEFEGE
jgi:hypothetical protein